MSTKLSVLESMVEEDFGLTLTGNRWASAIDHDSLVVDREKQIFFWNSEDIVGDEYVYLTRVRHYNHNDAKEYLRNHNATTTFIHEVKNKEEYVVYPALVKVFHNNLLNEDRDYFYRRTINDETISKFQLGYYDGYYMIPVYQDGLLKQFQMRRDLPTKEIHGYYKNAGAFLFNSEVLKYTDEIVIVEGVTSCLVLNQNNIRAVSYTSGAEGFMREWFPYFLHQRKIYLVYDNDSAGRNGAFRTAEILGESRCKIYTFSGYDQQGYDANDFFKDKGTPDAFIDLIKNESKYSFELPKEKKERKYGRG